MKSAGIECRSRRAERLSLTWSWPPPAASAPRLMFARPAPRAFSPLVCAPRARRRARAVLVACAGPGGGSDCDNPSQAGSAPRPPESLPKTAVFRLALLSGAVAGFTVDAILFPLDTLKTRLQVRAGATAGAAGGALRWVTSLYAGFGPAVVASAPAAATFFGTYDVAKRVLGELFGVDDGSVGGGGGGGGGNNSRWAPLVHMAAAAAGDVTSSTVRSPFEVVKQRLQSGVYSGGAGQAVSQILRTEGVAGFFTGYTSLILRELPFDALQFPLYEAFKRQWLAAKNRARPPHQRAPQLDTWESCVCGSTAGGIAAAVTTPLDVVKTRLMTQAAESPKYSGIVHGLRTIAAEEGPRALLSGIAPRVLWISLGGAIFFGAYEASKKALAPVIAKSSAHKPPKSE